MVGPESSLSGSDHQTIEETALRVFQREGYRVARPQFVASSSGTLAVLEAKDHRALVRFLWGHAEDWDDRAVRDFRLQMEDLKATRGYLITNGLFSSEAQQAAIELGVSLTDGPNLNETLNLYAPSVGARRREPEPPLPFARSIPWFVGISLALVAAVVIVLISIALALTPMVPPA
ncbi:MAG: restriction endonuclease [Chloroflexi bacterium]|nr:restriction endonuclease [Chloroflexota bacterium]